MRLFSTAIDTAHRSLSLRLKDDGDFHLCETRGTAPNGRTLEFEGTFEAHGDVVTLNCQFEVETRLTGADEDDATAIRRRCREVFTASVGAGSASVAWKGHTEVLKEA